MEESRLVALHDELCKHKGQKGLGSRGGNRYSWANTNKDKVLKRADGLPNNALYANFVKSGTYDPNVKHNNNHGDGRTIKRDFSDIPALVDDKINGRSNSSSSDNYNSNKSTERNRKKLTKEEKKAVKKAAKLEAKRQAKLEEKRQAKRKAKEQAALQQNQTRKKRKRDEKGEQNFDVHVGSRQQEALKEAKKSTKSKKKSVRDCSDRDKVI